MSGRSVSGRSVSGRSVSGRRTSGRRCEVFLFGLPFNLKNLNSTVIALGCSARIVGGMEISLRCLTGRLGVPGGSFVLLRVPVTLLLASIVVAIAISRSDYVNHVLSCHYSTELATCTVL